MKRVLVAVAACAVLGVGLFGPIAAVAGLDRGGNVLYEDGDSSASWFAPLFIAALCAWSAWEQSQKRAEESKYARESISELRRQLYEQKDLVSSLGKRIEKFDELAHHCQLLPDICNDFMNGVSSEEDFDESITYIATLAKEAHFVPHA